MSARVWLAGILLALLAVVVAACGARPAVPTAPTALSGGSVPGLEEVLPLSEYRLSLTLDPAAERLRGRGEVTFVNQTGVALREVVFRLYPNLPRYGAAMGIGPVWVNEERTPTMLRANNTALVVPLPRRLAPEASVTISMAFDVQLPARTDDYVLFGLSEGIWCLPDAYPLLAVHDGSRWHEEIAPEQADAVFSSVASYDVTLTLPATLTLATTGSVVSVDAGGEGQLVHRIVGTPLREFAWLASSEYRHFETTAGGVRVRSFYLPGDETGGQAALNAGTAALRVYSQAFGPYPFAEMTVAQAPLSYFGMEYPGLNLIGVDLYRDKREELEMRVVHEIAHQWWYSQVGNDQINVPWLDEGLAEYSTADYYAEVYGQARRNALVNQRWLAPYRALVDSGLDAVVNQPATAFGAEYEVIVYAKAALFFDALYQQLGNGLYHSVLQEYLRRFRWRIAAPDDLLRLAEEVSGQELDSLYGDWILGLK